MYNFIKRLELWANKFSNPHRAFLRIAIVFGLLMVFLTPPFQTPDEINHFYRAWQVSTGTFSSVKQNQRLGGYIPKSLEEFSSQFRPYTLNPYNRMSLKWMWQTRLIELNQEDVIFKDYANTALYSAFLYLPQALGIAIGKQFGVSPFWLMYLGRLFSLLTFIILGYFTIKILPFKKWFFVLLLSLPMALLIHASLSADTLLNSLSFLIIALFFNLSFNDNVQQISYKDILTLLVLSVLMGLSKLIYVPILFLFALIPSRKFISLKAKIITLTIVIGAGLATAFVQKSIINSKYIPYSEYNIKYKDQSMLKEGVDINKQVEFILENPKHTIKTFVKSFFSEFKHMTRSYIGVLGYADIKLPNWFIYLSYLAIFLLSALNTENDNMPKFSILYRGYFGLIAFGLLGLIMLSQYLSWDLVGENKVYPLQGRYFIPVFPLVFIMIFNVLKIEVRFLKHNAIAKKVLFFCLFSAALSVYMIAAKSYNLVEYKTRKWAVNYSFKEIEDDTIQNESQFRYVMLKDDTIASLSVPIKKFMSDEKVFAGSKSLKLTNNNPYGFTTKIFKGQANDKLIVSCRTSSTSGYIAVQEYPKGIFYHSSKAYPQKDSLEWEYRELQFILPDKIEKNSELRVFVWFPGNDSLYVDNFSIVCFDKN